MFFAEGVAGWTFKGGIGIRINCLTDQYKPLGVTQVGEAADFNEPKYSAIEVKQQDAATSKNTAQAPEGTTYAKGANAPEWATVGQDGIVTVKPSLDVKPGDYTVPVVVTYPDSSTDNAVVNVTVKEKEKSLAEQHDPQFGETTVEREGAATIPAPEGLPEGTKVAAGEGVPEWVTVYEDGSIEAKPTRETEDKEYTVPVVVTYSDKSTDEATAKVTVTKKPDNQIYSPEFGSITVQANRSAKTPAIEGLPEGTKFALAEGAPDWASIDDKGVIELNPGGEVDAKGYTVPVTVTYPDGTTDNAELKVTVTERAINELHDPTYSDVTVKQGDEVTAPAPTDVAEGATFEAGEGVPSWITVNPDGTVTAKPGEEVEAKEYTVPVKVSYEDGSGDDTTVNITVTVKPTNEKYNPTYPDADVKQGSETTVAPPADVDGDAEFALGEGAPAWASVNLDGTVTLKPSKDVKPGNYDVPVVITYPDGSTTTTTLKVTIKEQDKQNDNTGSTGSGDGLFGSLSGSSNGSSGSSSITGSSPFGYFIAALFGTVAIGAGLFGLYNWARDHGYVR
nr:Rib/alpha-like domain-containing protein [Corynebacterium evansiae]